MEPFPPLRAIEAIPVEHEGQSFICLRDPQGFVEEQVLLSPAAFFIATLLDGKHGARDIQLRFMRETGGQLVQLGDIETVATHLDEHGFLMSRRFEEVYRGVLDDFERQPSRAAYLAGRSYPDEEAPLREYLDAMFFRDEGPKVAPFKEKGRSAKALIVPHIDFDRGGHSYAHGYLALTKGPAPQVAFIFGVAHSSPPVPFVLTKKGYDTPLGEVKTDAEIVAALAKSCSYDPFEHEIVHRTEHSIEFQAVMLAHLFGSQVRIVPVLCGSFEEDGAANGVPASVDAFLDACKGQIERLNGNACVIAAADLAHVGRCFGDDFEVDDALVNRIETRDREDLRCVTALDARGWYDAVMADGNERRVCGVNNIYAMLRCVEGTAQEGSLLHYGYAPDPSGGIVSFAGIALT